MISRTKNINMINFIEKLLLPSIIMFFAGVLLVSDALNLNNNITCIIGFALFIVSLTFLISISFYIKIGFFGFIGGVLLSISICCLFAAFIMGQVSWLPENCNVHKLLWFIGFPLLFFGGCTTTTTIIIVIRRRR